MHDITQIFLCKKLLKSKLYATLCNILSPSKVKVTGLFETSACKSKDCFLISSYDEYFQAPIISRGATQSHPPKKITVKENVCYFI